jgi:hypothetical protein
MVIGVAACALAGPECWVAAAEEEAAFAGTGALVGGSGLGVAKGYRWVVGNQVRNYERAGIAGVCFRSFSGDTRVLMGDGSTKSISEVEEGDTVMAADPETGERGPRRVSDVWVHQDDLVTLSVGGKRVVTTEDHPYWDAAHRQWRRADALGADSRLLTADGHFVPVQGLLRRTTRHAAAYNLTVADLHTYYVLAGNTPVLVHNTNGCWPGLDDLSASAARPAKGGLTHAGREYQKHMGRGELPKVPGKQLDTAGQDYLDDILTTPGTQRVPINGGGFRGGYYYIRPDGAGAAFDSNGMFQYFGKF